ncbi:MAG: hypothetical protein R6W90_13950 [Ignavibacteriaceae bacterium]
MDDINFFPFYFELTGNDTPESADKINYAGKEKMPTRKENEWQQEYNLIYSSYVLEYNLEFMG